MIKTTNDDKRSTKITAYSRKPLGVKDWIEIEIPDPPKPREGEVWVNVNNDQCSYSHTEGNHLDHHCRKIKVKEVQE